LEINDEAKQIVHELGTAINSAVEQSPQVAEAIERLREAGYEMELTLRLEIGLRQHDEDEEETANEETTLELTDEDKRTLRGMKIRIDPEQ
jgi:P2-related tail formation protein